MEFISAKDAARKWGIGERRVQYYCSNAMIPGAVNMGKQWLIPSAAERPADGRTKGAQKNKGISSYHFPVYIYSRGFVSGFDFEEEDRKLLEAQKLYLGGCFAQSMEICQEMLKGDPDETHKVGIYSTIAYDSLMLGLYLTFTDALVALERIAGASELHREDYRMIIATIHQHLSWKRKELDRIDIEKLSPEAFYYYEAMQLQMSAIAHARESQSSMKNYELFCQQLHLEGFLPLELMTNCILSNIYATKKELEKRNDHVCKACEIALKNGWLSYLAKYYISLEAEIGQCLAALSPESVSKVKELAFRHIKNFRQVSEAVKGKVTMSEFFEGDSEILLLLASDLDERSIAAVLGVEEENVRRKLEGFMESRRCDSLEQLRERVKTHLGTEKEEE